MGLMNPACWHYLAGFGYLAGLIPLHPGSETFLSAAARSLKKHPTTRGALDFGRIASVRYLNAARWDLALRQMEPLIALSREVGDEQSLMFGLSFSFIIGFRLDDETLYRSRGPELFERAQRNQSSQFAAPIRFTKVCARCGPASWRVQPAGWASPSARAALAGCGGQDPRRRRARALRAQAGRASAGAGSG